MNWYSISNHLTLSTRLVYIFLRLLLLVPASGISIGMPVI